MSMHFPRSTCTHKQINMPLRGSSGHTHTRAYQQTQTHLHVHTQSPFPATDTPKHTAWVALSTDLHFIPASVLKTCSPQMIIYLFSVLRRYARSVLSLKYCSNLRTNTSEKCNVPLKQTSLGGWSTVWCGGRASVGLWGERVKRGDAPNPRHWVLIEPLWSNSIMRSMACAL